MCKSKIHRATVTEANVHYVGSLTVDRDLLEASGIEEYEQVHVVNVTNGERLITYAIEGEAGSGVMCLNGAAAHKGAPGDIIIVIAYGQFDEIEMQSFAPQIVFVDAQNRRVTAPQSQMSRAETILI